jgi:plastocyanin domain-containing protein
MKDYRKLPAILFLAVFALFSNGGSCQKGKDLTTPTDDCQNYSIASKKITIQSFERFDLIANSANNECYAVYLLGFHWAQHSRALTDKTMPPLTGLESAFRPEDEPGKPFTHDAPYMTTNASGENEWRLAFTVNNPKSTFSGTSYAIHTSNGSVLTEDSINVLGQINYYAK